MFTQVSRYFSDGSLRALPTWGLAVAIAAAAALSPACSRKSGCPINEPAKVKTDKNGNFKSAKGASNLFPKDMRRGSRKG